jgi:hypothetical protein
MHHLDLDECIAKLKRRELLREEILEAICEKVKEVLMRESNVVHVAAPITVVGDIHGYRPSSQSCLCKHTATYTLFTEMRLFISIVMDSNNQAIHRPPRDLPHRRLRPRNKLPLPRRLRRPRIL